MEGNWDLKSWKPSLFGQKLPRPKNLHSLADRARDLTLLLIDLPYDPENWLYRSDLLGQAGFPELAIGDAYKGKLLIEAMCSQTTYSQAGDSALLTWGMRNWMIDQADKFSQPLWTDSTLNQKRLLYLFQRLEVRSFIRLADALFMGSCFWDALRLSIEGLKKYPSDVELKAILADAREMMIRRFGATCPLGMPEDRHESMAREGQVTVVPYPWLSMSHLVRNKDRIHSLAESLKSKSSCCRLLSKVALDNGQDRDSYGIFASRMIQKGEVILEDPTLVCASSNLFCCPTCAVSLIDPYTGFLDTKVSRVPCCQALFCCKGCADEALKGSHLAICKKDLSHIIPGSCRLATHDLLNQIMLAKTVASTLSKGCLDPLESSIVGHLRPHLHTGYVPISLDSTYVYPIKTLAAFGVDVFADTRFDTWVLHTINCRLANNARQVVFRDTTCTALNEHRESPFQSFFNHSCDPNVHQETADSDLTTLIYSAQRRINKGEELCISYDDEASFFESSVETRQELLRPWFSEPCWCSRCEKERSLRVGL